jgi:hypothetical protein
MGAPRIEIDCERVMHVANQLRRGPQSYEFGTHTAWGFLDATTRGLADTAKTFADADAVNTLANTPLAAAFRTALGYVPQPLESDESRFADLGLNEIVVMERALTQDVPAAWPSAPESFGPWRQNLSIYLENLEQAVAAVPGYLSAAADRVNQANQDLLYVLEGAFASLAAATALDVFFGAGETVKLAISVAVIVAIQVAFLAILADLRGLFGALPTVPPLELPHFGDSVSTKVSDWTPMPKLADLSASPSVVSVRDING